MPIPSVSLGQTALSISRIGLGAMPLAINGRPTREQAIEVIHRALDLGVTLIDTADAYCQNEDDKHYGELIVAQALQTYLGSADVTVATKGLLSLVINESILSVFQVV
jgi:aryl-alcohol dehydrogenase-like predicted oxidoreductase